MATAKITVEGFVAKDPESRDAGQHRITTVTIPVEQGRKKDGQWVADTDQQGQKIVHWWEAEFWNEFGDEVAQTIRKGALVTVTGEPRPRAYLKKDGTAGIADTIVNASIAQVVRRPARGGGFGGGNGAPAAQQWGAGANGPQNGAQGGSDWAEEAPF